MTNKFEVSSDSQTVWINSANGALARFGRLGIDVHNATNTGCLHCTHGRQTPADWERFKRLVLDVYGVEVSDTHRPKWLKRTKATNG